jgi:tetratricopeptide (TPR) repeat protein
MPRSAPSVRLLGVGLVFAATLAHAQYRPAVPPSSDLEAAKAHFAAGSAYYDQANYNDAVREFGEAYRLSRRVDLLYNIALCYERLYQYDEAIRTLERYLSERPGAPDRTAIQTRIGNLKKLRASQPPPPAPDPYEMPPPEPQPPPLVEQVPVMLPPPPAPAPRRRWFLPGTLVMASGAGVLVAALATGATTELLYQDLIKKCPNNVCPAAERGRVELAQDLAVTTYVLLGIGGAALLAGAVILAVQGARERRAPLPVSLGPGGLAVAF